MQVVDKDGVRSISKMNIIKDMMARNFEMNAKDLTGVVSVQQYTEILLPIVYGEVIIEYLWL